MTEPADMKLSICYLYHDLMNTYGDRGNILCLVRRCAWRGIEATVDHVTVGDRLDPKVYDLYFFGGGQDWQQAGASADLMSGKGDAIREGVEDGAVLLSVCGGFQLLARYYPPFEGADLPGTGLFDAWTVAGRRRMIGNTVVDISYQPLRDFAPDQPTLAGFENHSGKTYLGPTCQALGATLIGYGNNGEDKLQGAIYKNAIGCYVHGSLLPKNPHLADYLITRALERRYGAVKLAALDDSTEWRAHQAACVRAKQTGNPGLVRR
jgi:lipid II isoglutaminyl synthase (glutamine-hydrolysing)